MRAPAAITAVRSAHRGEFIAHEVSKPRTTMTAAAKYAYLVNEIAFFQNCIFTSFFPGRNGLNFEEFTKG